MSHFCLIGACEWNTTKRALCRKSICSIVTLSSLGNYKMFFHWIQLWRTAGRVSFDNISWTIVWAFVCCHWTLAAPVIAADNCWRCNGRTGCLWSHQQGKSVSWTFMWFSRHSAHVAKLHLTSGQRNQYKNPQKEISFYQSPESNPGLFGSKWSHDRCAEVHRPLMYYQCKIIRI